MNRRGFTKRLAKMFGAVFGAIFGLPAVATLADPVLGGGASKWVDAGTLAELAPGAVKRFKYPVQAGWETREEAGFLMRAETGDEVVAFSARCTHAGCKVRFKDDEFHCPCHGGVFSRNGDPIAGPPTVPLVRFETRLDQDHIKVKA